MLSGMRQLPPVARSTHMPNIAKADDALLMASQPLRQVCSSSSNTFTPNSVAESLGSTIAPLGSGGTWSSACCSGTFYGPRSTSGRAIRYALSSPNDRVRTDPVQTIVEKVKDDKIKKVVLLAHSQGGIIMSTWVVCFRFTGLHAVQSRKGRSW